MIAYLVGNITYKDPTYFIIEVQGIGYRVNVSLYTYSAFKDSSQAVKMHTYLSIKEDSHTLYGFAEEAEKYMFIHLISVSGVGPSTGLMMLSSLRPQEIRHAIASNDIRTIQSVKGIGAKTAQRLILELKDKVAKLSEGGDVNLLTTTHTNSKNEALNALVTLGFSKQVAEKNIDSIIKKSTQELTVEELIRQALKMA
jgi:Holliday junction DNA helicase RuvA